ncbi:MAG: Holliday junction branch migration protein RuvA [Polyangiaceae bacterium]
MIARLLGHVQEEADGGLVVDVGGVGYEVTAPLGSVGRARREPDGRAHFYVHTHVREDAFTLFGFADEVDRHAFRALISVSSIGPKTAIGILSALPTAELANAIANKELSKLTSISGVGKKTAERLVLELRDKLSATTGVVVAGAAAPVSAPGKGTKGGTGGVLSGALVKMGYRVVEADRAVEQLGDRVQTEPLDVLLREALKLLAK